MYQYDQIDQKIVDERVAQYSDQVRRRLSGELSEEEFRPLRLQNGLYMQRHAYMHRIAILRARQMRQPRAAHQAARGLGGVIHRRQYAPVGCARVDRIVVERFLRHAAFHHCA